MLGGLAVSFLLLETFIYFAIRSKSEEISKTLNSKNSQISVVMASGLTELNSDEIAKFQQRVSSFKNGFIQVSQISSVLNGISDQAEKSDIRVLGIRS